MMRCLFALAGVLFTLRCLVATAPALASADEPACRPGVRHQPDASVSHESQRDAAQQNLPPADLHPPAITLPPVIEIPLLLARDLNDVSDRLAPFGEVDLGTITLHEDQLYYRDQRIDGETVLCPP